MKKILLIISFFLFPIIIFSQGVNNDVIEEYGYKSWTPFQVSIFDPIQLFGRDRDVYGLRINAIYGKNRNIYGFDLGLCNLSGDMYGIQIGMINGVEEVDKYIEVDKLKSKIVDERPHPKLPNKKEVIVSYYTIREKVPIYKQSNIYGLQIGCFNSTSTVVGYKTEAKTGIDPTGGTGVFKNERFLEYLLRGRELPPDSSQRVWSLNYDVPVYGRGDLFGFQVGMVNDLRDIWGIQLALGGNIVENLYGLQFGGLINFAREDVYGLQFGIMGNIADDIHGLQLGGMVNIVDNLYGLQFGGMYNMVKGDLKGIQFGYVNIVRGEVKGLQIGLFNSCNRITGIQIGFVNKISNGFIPISPFINFGFSF